MKNSWILVVLSWLATCSAPTPVPPPTAHPHYQLGSAYQKNGYWFYPAEDFSLDSTGLATILPPGRSGTTDDGELIDDSTLTAGMQTLQLPAIVTVTNLQNGLQLQVRVNDRAPADPGRLIALSPRAALLLQITAQNPAKVRVVIDAGQSRHLIDQLGGGPRIQVALATPGKVTAQDLPPPGQGGAGASHSLGLNDQDAATETVPDRLPERLSRVGTRPGQLYLRAGSFGRARYAVERSARLTGLGSDVISSRDGRETIFSVRAGPYASVQEADRALATAFARGVIDARITVE